MITVLAGKPTCMPQAQWNGICKDVGRTMNDASQELRFGESNVLPKQKKTTANHRGNYKTIVYSISYGGGQTVSHLPSVCSTAKA